MHADYIAENLRFSGFGTIGAAFNHDRNTDYRSNLEHNEGVGATTTRDCGLDTVFGFQADMKIINSLTVTAQMQSRRLSNGSSTPYFEWAYLKYNLAHNLSARLGRVVAPMFIISESRAVGYIPVRLFILKHAVDLSQVVAEFV